MRQRKHVIQNTASTKFRTFCKHSTLHGFYYFSDKRNWMVYAVWTSIIISSSILCWFLSQMIWEKFVEAPTFIVVETTHYPTTQIPFPAVIVCDTEHVYGPKTENITNILQYRNFDEKQIEDFYKSFMEIKRNDYVPSEHVKKMHKALHDLGHTYKVLLETFSKPCDVLMVQCTWRAQAHNCTDMFREVYTVAGYCCQFDMDFFREHADPNTNFVAGVEATEALAFTINGQKTTFTDTASDGYVSLFVYDADTRINTLDYPATLTPSGFFDVGVDVWAIDSTDDVKGLAVNARKCFMPGESFEGYTSQECMSMKVLKKVAAYCRCLPFHFSAKILQVEDFPTCSWERLMCVHQTLEKVKSEIKEIVYQNDCLQRCDYVHYATEIEYVRYQRKTRYTNNNFSDVYIHYTSSTCMKYKKQVIYSWDQMLANLGGIFGLCLGGSIISLIEIVWFAIDFIFTILKVRYTKTTPRKTHVFTLTNKDFTKVAKVKMEGKYKFVN